MITTLLLVRACKAHPSKPPTTAYSKRSFPPFFSVFLVTHSSNACATRLRSSSRVQIVEKFKTSKLVPFLNNVHLPDQPCGRASSPRFYPPPGKGALEWRSCESPVVERVIIRACCTYTIITLHTHNSYYRLACQQTLFERDFRTSFPVPERDLCRTRRLEQRPCKPLRKVSRNSCVTSSVTLGSAQFLYSYSGRQPLCT